MRKFLSHLFFGFLGLFLIIFFVANRQPVKISMDPTSLEDPAFYLGPVPMWTALAGTLFLGYGLGAAGMWFSSGGLRARANARKKEIRQLKAELALYADRPTRAESLPALRD